MNLRPTTPPWPASPAQPATLMPPLLQAITTRLSLSIFRFGHNIKLLNCHPNKKRKEQKKLLVYDKSWRWLELNQFAEFLYRNSSSISLFYDNGENQSALNLFCWKSKMWFTANGRCTFDFIGWLVTMMDLTRP